MTRIRAVHKMPKTFLTHRHYRRPARNLVADFEKKEYLARILTQIVDR